MAVNKLFEYQRSKQNSINDIKNGRIDITGKYEQNSKMPLFSESSEGISDYNLDTSINQYSCVVCGDESLNLHIRSNYDQIEKSCTCNNPQRLEKNLTSYQSPHADWLSFMIATRLYPS